jgi:hypothetical protein
VIGLYAEEGVVTFADFRYRGNEREPDSDPA